MREAYVKWVQTQGEQPVAMDAFSKRLYRFLKDRKIPHSLRVVKREGKTVRAVLGVQFEDSAEF
jgi:hypothetical protein